MNGSGPFRHELLRRLLDRCGLLLGAVMKKAMEKEPLPIVRAMADSINSGAYPAWLEVDRILIRAGFTAAEINEHRDAAIALAAKEPK